MVENKDELIGYFVGDAVVCAGCIIQEKPEAAQENEEAGFYELQGITKEDAGKNPGGELICSRCQKSLFAA